jgi:tetratricopeptide (TPR) repeat protein
MTQPDRPMLIDLYRFLRIQKALNGESDYYVLANALQQSGYPGEVKSVLDEAFATGISPSKPEFADLRSNSNRQIAEDKASLPAQEKSALAAASGTAVLKIADAYYGYGDYAKAATLYRAALQKGGVDANLVNTRLGLALAVAGQKAEAEAALKAVSGNRADLASYMLVWLQQRPA